MLPRGLLLFAIDVAFHLVGKYVKDADNVTRSQDCAPEHRELWLDLRRFEQDQIISAWLDDPEGDQFVTCRIVDEVTAAAVIVFARPGEPTPFPWTEVTAASQAGVPVLVVGYEQEQLPPGAQRCASIVSALLGRSHMPAQDNGPKP